MMFSFDIMCENELHLPLHRYNSLKKQIQDKLFDEC